MPDKQRKIRFSHDKPTPDKGMRKLVIRGQTWLWRYGSNLIIQDPQGQTHSVAMTDFTNDTWSSLERSIWKKSHKVTPGMVVEYINRQILGYRDDIGFPKDTIPEGYNEPRRSDFQEINLPPRGRWQWRSGPWIVELCSPEGIVTSHRVYHVIGMTLEVWMERKSQALADAGITIEEIMRTKPLSDRISPLLEYDAPTIPRPTRDHIKNLIKTAPWTSV